MSDDAGLFCLTTKLKLTLTLTVTLTLTLSLTLSLTLTLTFINFLLPAHPIQFASAKAEAVVSGDGGVLGGARLFIVNPLFAVDASVSTVYF